MSKTKSQLEADNRELRAKVALVDDAIERVAFVDDAGQPVIQSHEQMHKHHGDRPYIGCIFCREAFGELEPLDDLVREFRQKIEQLGPSSGEEGAKFAYGLAADELEARIAEARELAREMRRWP